MVDALEMLADDMNAGIRQKMMDPDVGGNAQDDPIKALTAAAGLLIGSPEFQKR